MTITKNELKSVAALLTKKGRREAGLFVAEGIRLMEEALRHKFRPDRVYQAPALLNERGQQLVTTLTRQGTKTVEVSAREIRTMSDTDTPQGILGVFPLPKTDWAKLSGQPFRKLLWCENVSDPGNLGTLLRCALAFGFGPVILTGESANAYSPKVVRSSAGAVFGLKIARAGTAEILKLARQKKLPIVATGRDGKKLDSSAKKVFKKGKLILALGSEGHGLSEEIVKAAALTVRLEHSSKVESLNVAVAGSIIMNSVYTLSGEHSK